MTDLLDALCERLGASLDRQGRAHADCPLCGASGHTRGGHAAFHFYLYDLPGKGRGAVCWSCGYRGGLRDLARELDVQGTDNRPARALPARPTPPWEVEDNWARWLAFQAPRQESICKAWRTYKPLSAATIAAQGLSVGRLAFYDEERRRWYQGRHPRLLLPLVTGRRVVGIRGRAYLPQDDGAKWITASYSELALMGLDDVAPGSTCIWCENLVDRLLVQEAEPGVVGLASGGLTWRSEWLHELARRRPRHVLIWFDHDLSGNGSAFHGAEFLRLWRAEQEARRRDRPELAARPFPSPPEPRGPKLANDLLAAGVRASVYRWPHGTPRKFDLGSALMQERRAA